MSAAPFRRSLALGDRCGPALILTVGLTACLVAAPSATFDSARAYEHIRRIIAFGPRPAGSAALEETRGYIKKELTALHLRVNEQAFEAQTPVGPIRMINVIATIPGTRAERLLVAGHYDTKLFRQFRFVGANDGGSSAAFLLEIARVLSARRNPLTIELVFLDGEEAFGEWQGTDHTYGSRHYVEAARREGRLGTIKALILVDMIGDRSLNIRREEYSTRWLTDILWASARRLNLQQYFLDESTAVEDDHVAFLKAGIPAVDLIDLDYAVWHTPNDTLDHVSARSLQAVGDVVLDALPEIEKKLLSSRD